MPSRININLLPPELKEIKKRQQRKGFIVRVSIFTLLAMIVITASLLSFVVIQNARITQANKSLENIRNRIDTYKDSEAIAIILASRLDGIHSIILKDYPQIEALNLITALTPKDVRILAFNVDRNNKVTISAETNSVSSADTFFINLTDPKFNEGKISTVVVESMSRNKDRLIKFDLAVTLPGSVSSQATGSILAPPPK